MNNTNIYIIDDNIAISDSLKFLFESFLNLCVTAYNDPLLFLKEFPSQWKGCLIIDLFMPSMNGIDLINELKKVNSEAQIIVISGYQPSEAVTKILACGASAFITKPFKTEYLIEQVKKILKND